MGLGDVGDLLKREAEREAENEGLALLLGQVGKVRSDCAGEVIGHPGGPLRRGVVVVERCLTLIDPPATVDEATNVSNRQPSRPSDEPALASVASDRAEDLEQRDLGGIVGVGGLLHQRVRDRPHATMDEHDDAATGLGIARRRTLSERELIGPAGVGDVVGSSSGQDAHRSSHAQCIAPGRIRHFFASARLLGGLGRLFPSSIDSPVVSITG